MKLTLSSAMGGFLFGFISLFCWNGSYDTGVIGGANLFLHLDFPSIT